MTSSYKYEEIVSSVGRFGVYQRCVLVTALLCTLLDVDPMTLVFLGASMRHWCLVDRLANLSHTQQRYISAPAAAAGYDVTDDVTRRSSCSYYAFNYSEMSREQLVSWNRCVRFIASFPLPVTSLYSRCVCVYLH